MICLTHGICLHLVFVVKNKLQVSRNYGAHTQEESRLVSKWKIPRPQDSDSQDFSTHSKNVKARINFGRFQRNARRRPVPK